MFRVGADNLDCAARSQPQWSCRCGGLYGQFARSMNTMAVISDGCTTRQFSSVLETRQNAVNYRIAVVAPRREPEGSSHSFAGGVVEGQFYPLAPAHLQHCTGVCREVKNRSVLTYPQFSASDKACSRWAKLRHRNGHEQGLKTCR